MDEKLLAAIITIVATPSLVAIVNYFQHHGLQKKARHAERLKDQLHKLYGPLYFFAEHNRELQKCGAAIDKLNDTEIAQVNWKDDEGTRKSVHEEADKTLEVMNRYTKKVIANNQRMVRFIKDNFALCHPDDIEMLQRFVTHWNRWKLEQGLPYRISRKLDRVIFYESKVVDQIKERFDAISAELRALATRRRRKWPSQVN